MKLSRFRASLVRVVGATLLAAAALAGGAQAGASAAPAAPGDHKMYGLFKNHTQSQLTLIPGLTRVSEGSWMTPPRTIRPLKVIRFGSTSTTANGGTVATIAFQTPSGNVRIFWSNRAGVDNEVRCDVPSTMRCDVDYSLEPRSVVTFNLF
jgi:hypothetical protein